MTVWEWATSGVPPLTAFMPPVTKSIVSWQQYKQNLDGAPGTRAVPAPNDSIPQSPLLLGADHRSSDAPPQWYPQLWYERTLPGLPFPAGAGDCGVAVYSDNQLPVPAIDPTRGTPRFVAAAGAAGRQFGAVTPAYMNPYRRAQTRRRVQARNA